MTGGARRVGKTCIVRRAGRQLFANFIEINMAADLGGDCLLAKVRTVGDFCGKLLFLPFGKPNLQKQAQAGNLRI